MTADTGSTARSRQPTWTAPRHHHDARRACPHYCTIITEDAVWPQCIIMTTDVRGPAADFNELAERFCVLHERVAFIGALRVSQHGWEDRCAPPPSPLWMGLGD